MSRSYRSTPWSPYTRSCSADNTKCMNCVSHLVPLSAKDQWLTSRSSQITELLTLSTPVRPDTACALIWQVAHFCTVVTLHILQSQTRIKKKTSEESGHVNRAMHLWHKFGRKNCRDHSPKKVESTPYHCSATLVVSMQAQFQQWSWMSPVSLTC